MECGGCWCRVGRCWYGVWEVLVWSVGSAGVECGRYMHWCEVWELLMWSIVVWSVWRETECKGCKQTIASSIPCNLWEALMSSLAGQILSCLYLLCGCHVILMAVFVVVSD